MNGQSRYRILVIEDDLRLAELLRTGLEEKGHSVATADAAEEGELLCEQAKFDAVVLDIGLPGRSGFTVVENLCRRPSRPAIVMLTALDQEDHIVHGLDAGADDYLTKPFSFPELAARIASAVRRTRIAASDQCCFGPFRLVLAQRRLFCDHTEVHISRSEYLLLHELALHCGEIVPRRQLIQAVWGNAPIHRGSLDTLVNTLREKLDACHPGLISTIRGNGYSLLDDAELR